jgi:hypothetical protein
LVETSYRRLLTTVTRLFVLSPQLRIEFSAARSDFSGEVDLDSVKG